MFFLIYILFFYQNAIILTRELFINYLNNVIPSLLSILFLMNLLLNSKIQYFLFKNKVIKELLLIFISVLLGAPASLIMLNKLTKENIISVQKRNTLLSSFSSFSFSFLCYLFNGHYLYLLILLISEIFIYLCLFKNEQNAFQICNFALNDITINKTIKDTSYTLIFIFISSLMMNLIFVFNLNAYNLFAPLIMFFEFSYPASYVLELSISYKYIFLLLCSSLTSISIFLQIYYYDKNYDLFYHLRKRVCVGIFSFLLVMIFFF